jgi:hypothetical protein
MVASFRIVLKKMLYKKFWIKLMRKAQYSLLELHTIFKEFLYLLNRNIKKFITTNPIIQCHFGS